MRRKNNRKKFEGRKECRQLVEQHEEGLKRIGRLEQQRQKQGKRSWERGKEEESVSSALSQTKPLLRRKQRLQKTHAWSPCILRPASILFPSHLSFPFSIPQLVFPHHSASSFPLHSISPPSYPPPLPTPVHSLFYWFLLSNLSLTPPSHPFSTTLWAPYTPPVAPSSPSHFLSSIFTPIRLLTSYILPPHLPSQSSTPHLLLYAPFHASLFSEGKVLRRDRWRLNKGTATLIDSLCV